jgi:hypothetical protein
MGKLRAVHYELLEHPPSSPDFAPSDFYLLPKLKLFPPPWSAFFFKSRGDCNCSGVFCRSYKEPLQGRHNGTTASLVRETMLKNKIILKL